MFSPVEGAPLAESTPRPGLPLEPWRLVRAVRQGARRILLAMALALPLGALVALTLAPREFVSQSVLVWEPQEPSPSPARELQTLASAVKLPGNLEQVRARLQIDDPLEEIGKRVEVDVVSNESNVLTLSGVGKSAQDAARFIQTVTDVFLQERVRMAGRRNCWCIEDFRDGHLTPTNIDVMECSRLQPAFRGKSASMAAGSASRVYGGGGASSCPSFC